MHTRTNRLTLLAALACAALPATSTITISARSPDDAAADRRDWTRYDRNAPPRPPRPGPRAARRRKLARRGKLARRR
jgi:hypothetical protein